MINQQKYFDKFKKGDTFNYHGKKLIVGNKYSVRHFVNRYQNESYDEDEMIFVSVIGECMECSIPVVARNGAYTGYGQFAPVLMFVESQHTNMKYEFCPGCTGFEIFMDGQWIKSSLQNEYVYHWQQYQDENLPESVKKQHGV